MTTRSYLLIVINGIIKSGESLKTERTDIKSLLLSMGNITGFLSGSSRWECDDYNSDGTKYFGLSPGDFWRVFVR